MTTSGNELLRADKVIANEVYLRKSPLVF